MKDGETVLNDTGKALKDLAGIDVFEDEQQTQVKDMVTILDELNEKYDGLSEKDQLALGEKISGKNNAATFQALMANWDKFKQIQEEFKNGDHFGSMAKENEQYVDSIAGKLSELGTIWTDVFSDIFTQDFIKGGLDGLIAISEVIRDLVSVTSELGITFPVLFGAFGGLSNAFKGMGKDSKGFKQVQKGLSKMGIDASDAAIMMGNLDSSNKKVSKSMAQVNTSTKGTSKIMGTIRNGVDKVGTSVLNAGTHIKNFALGFGKMALVTGVIQGVAKAFDYATSAVKDQNKEIRNNIEDLQSSVKAEEDKLKYIDENGKRYQELIKKQEQYSKSGKELTQEQVAEMQELQDITNTLAEMFPDLVIGYSSDGSPIIAMGNDMEYLKQKTQDTINLQEKLIENQRNNLAKNATKMIQEGELFGKDGFGKKNDIVYNTENYKKSIESWKSGLLGGYKTISQYEDNFLNASGKKKMKHLEQYKKMTQAQQKDIDKYYTKALESVNEYYELSTQIQQAAFDQISNMDVYKGLKGDKLNTANQFISSIDWGELDTAGQQKWIGATEKILGLIDSGDPRVQKWSESWSKANNEFKNTGDYEKYTKNLNGLAKELSSLTGVDFSTIMQGLTQVYAPLSQSEQELQNFLSTYNKTRDDLLNGDPIAQALARQFEGLDNLWNDLLTNDNAYTVDGKLTYNMMVEIGNRKDIPKEISDLAKSFASDNKITEQETKIITDLVFTLKEGNTDEARKKLEEINKELAKHGREPIPMEVLTDVKGGEKVEELNKKLEGLPKDTKTLVESEVIGEEDIETLKQLLNDSSLSDNKVISILMENQDAITKAGGLKQWLDSIPQETWTKLGVKEENVEQAKQGLEEVSQKQDEVDSKESTIKVNGEETQGAIEDINSLIEYSTQLKDGTYKIDFETNVGDTITQLGSVADKVNEISSAFGSIPNKTINIETAQASKNITGLKNNIQQFNSLSGGVKTVKFNTDTATASKNVTGLRSNVSSYISAYCGKSYSTRFNTETAQASKNVSGLRGNVASYVSAYGGKSYTTTFNVVTKYTTQGSPTPASSGAKPKGRSISTLENTPTPMSTDVNTQPLTRDVATTPQPLGDTPVIQPRANVDTSHSIISGSIKYDVDMLREMTNQIKQLEHEFNKLDKAIDKAVGNEKIRLLEKQNELLERQKASQKELLSYLYKQQTYYRDYLTNHGFFTDSSGNLTNYEEKLNALENHVDSLKKKAEDAQKASSDYKGENESYKNQLEENSKAAQDAYDKEREKLSEIKDYLSAYMDATFDKIPDAIEKWEDLNSKIEDNIDTMTKMKYDRMLRPYIDKANELEHALDRVNDQMDLLDAKYEHATGEEQLEYYNKKIQYLEREREVLKQLSNQYRAQQVEMMAHLKQFGVEFDDSSLISNYSKVLDKFSEHKDYEKIKEYMDDYIDLVRDKLPDAWKDWLEAENKIKDAKKEQLKVTKDMEEKITDIIKKEVDKRIDLIEKEADERIKALKKEQDAYNDARKEADYQNDYNDQLKKIQDLQKEYDRLSGDNSLGSKKRLEELKKEIEEEQKRLEELVQNKIDDDVNDMFDKEQDRIEEDKDNAIKDLEDKYSDENIQNIVKEMLNTGVYTDIDGKLRSLQEVMLEYIDKYQDGLSATGALIKDEWIGNLEIALETMKNISDINASLNLNKFANGRMSSPGSSRSSNPVNFNAPLINIEGNVDESVMNELKGLEKRITNIVVKEIMNKVDGR
ncbi:TP901 family phage tail tape measure protein [[Clostridium] sordellii]|uniref:phage tail tape measure protein n=1 Tax=Paraclostridium sordellii TaxID=1505 RepID=UPI0005E0D4D6|nr:phage tail tape measure protein [Paeniclostridium sordellii]CEQ01738.1 TP901 family phage tail tape measure protein [[Clostridium] sordellii] [Paeniclostridium sordellii]